MAMLSTIFGSLAVVLAMAGLFGGISYTAARRTNDTGIRVALGANRHTILMVMLRETMIVHAIGLPAGVILTLLTGRTAAALFFELQPADPVTLAVAGIAIGGRELSASVAGGQHESVNRAASRMNTQPRAAP